MNIAALRIRTTEIIDRSETYNRKAVVLPKRSSPQKASTTDVMRVIGSSQPSRQPYDQHDQNDGSNYSIT
jgi:hypothetical protein